MNEVLALVAIGVVALSGLLGALVGLRTRVGDRVFAAAMVLGSTCGLVAAFRSIAGAGLGTWSRPWNVPGGALHVQVDALSGMFLVQIFLIGALGATNPVWWGVLLFSLGMVSAVLGVAFAIGQHDLKRLLAYHSVENIGIIVMGLGMALIGRGIGHPTVVLLGLAGALLHVWNHGLFKALLFLSGGSVIHATHTREIDALGGLGKKLPRTALAFLVGAVAICGLPPLNGFVSELFVHLGMLRASALDRGTLGIAAALGVPVLALVGALAALCFAKVFGVVFLGAPRSAHGQTATESPWLMVGPMVVLGVLCIFIGALPPLVAPVLDHATSAWLGSTEGQRLSALAPLGAVAWMNALLTVSLILVGAMLFKTTSEARVARRPTWDCGYSSPTARMQYTASSLGDWLVGMFRIVLRPRLRAPHISGHFPASSRFESHVPEVVLDLGILPLGHALARVAAWFRWIQYGSVHLYVLYVLGALILMLSVWR